MGYFLFDNENPNAPVRDNGIRGWFHPQRHGGLAAIRLIVIHTTENTPDLHPPDVRAENVAAFQARVERPSSYHRIVDSDSTVPMLPDVAVAFGAKGANTAGLHMSFAGYAHMWDQLPDWWIDAALRQAAPVVREWAAKYRIPFVRLSRSEIRAGRRGFAAHADTEAVFGTPGRRHDPGGGFPWARFLDLARHDQEDIMATADELREIIREEIAASEQRLRTELRDLREIPNNLEHELDVLRIDMRKVGEKLGFEPKS